MIRLKLLAVLVASSLAFGSPAAMADDWKIIEKSSKQAPEWLSAQDRKGWIEITVEGTSLQEARHMAELDLERTIIRSVAVNVESSTLEELLNSVTNKGIESSETFSQTTNVNAAKLPFIKGISLSEADVYWVLKENKKSKQRLYTFALRYSMPQSRLDEMRRQFDDYDAAKSADLKRLQAAFDHVGSLEEVNEATATLKDLQSYFFDSVRLSQAQGLEKRYRELLRSVNLSGELTGDGTARFTTSLKGRPFAVGRNPEVKSECARILSVTPQNEGSVFIVRFSTEDCLSDEPNSIDAFVRVGAARLSASVSF